MASLSPTSAPAGATASALDALIALGLPDADARRAAFAAFEALPVAPAPGTRWKHDLRKLDLGSLTVAPAPILALTEPVNVAGAIVCDFATARREHADVFGPAYDRAFANQTKFGALTRAFAPDGIFIHVADGVKLTEPIRLGIVAIEGEDALPYVIVSAGSGAAVEIIEMAGGDTGGALVCAATELVAGDGARITYSILQQYGPETKAIATRRATIGHNAEVHIAFAAIGARLCVEDIAERAIEPGASARVTGLFFADGDQHVDVVSDLQHVVGSTSSDTVVKGVAGGRAQARFLGNIKIAAHAHGSEAMLRDDSLLLSPQAHIDSIPALEISANDVKAFHGATVGALDDENLFYIMSRGLDRTTAERLVTLGFLEPAIARFSSETVREHLRSALGAKLGMIVASDAKTAQIVSDFPILAKPTSRGKRLVYLDSAASSQKPQAVIDSLVDYYSNYNANIHRGVYEIAARATDAFEAARAKVATFINAAEPAEIIFTRNTTEAINLVSFSWGLTNLKPGDAILTTRLEHHSNLVPWQLLAAKTGAELRFIEIDGAGNVLLDDLEEKLSGVKLVAITHISNTLGSIVPLDEIVPLAHAAGAVVLVDGAQSVPHMPIDVRDLEVDFFAASGHKMCGPTGIGFLYGRRELLEAMPPFLTGGDMIKAVAYTEASFNELPWKFEAGTSNIADAIGLGVACDYLTGVGMEWIRAHEIALTRYALERLQNLVPRGLAIYGPARAEDRAGVISFNFADIHAHDLASLLDLEGVCVRAGHHCTMPLMDKFNWPATARASFYLYNTEADVDALIDALEKAATVFRVP